MSRKLLVIHPDHCMEVQFDQQITIGRDVFNSLSLQDPEVSRSHAIVFEQDGEVMIKDLKSRNGVYVAGEKVTESGLKAGDEVILGTTVMIYEPPEDLDVGAALSKRGRYLVDKRQKKAAIKPKEPKTMYTFAEMDKAIEDLFENSKDATFFTFENAVMILKAIKSMNDAIDSGDLFETTVRQALTLLGGHRGVIMETDETKEHLKVRSILSVDSVETILIGQPILNVVLNNEKALHCANILRDTRFEQIAKKSERPIHSFVCAPIRGREELFGFLYLDSEDNSVSYDFSALRSLYFLASHLGSLLRARPMHFHRPANAVSLSTRE